MMSTAITQTGFTREAFDAFLQTRDEPAWLTERRRQAWEAFEELPMPDRRQEEWMRTDIRTFRLDRFSAPAPEGPEAPLARRLLAEGVDLAGSSTTTDSRQQSLELDPELARQGVLFGSLDELVREHPDLVEQHFGGVVDFTYDKFAALHAAFWSGGTLLYVPRGVTIEKPLHTLSALTADGVDFAHTLVVLEDGAEATLMAETASVDPQAAGLHCGAIELVVGPNARLRYVNLQNWGSGVWHFAHQKGRVGRDGRLQWTIGALGARLAKVNQHVALSGEGADTQVNGVMFTEGKQHLSYHTLQHHEAAHCSSDLLYKAAMQDRSRTVWRGMIKVDPGAQKTNGYQRNDNLLLSSQSRADSIPGLEIEADDVRCTHGSTSGRVDEEMIFYARCRGFTLKEAVQMIVTGFFQQVFDRITIESVREALSLAIARRVREYE